MASNDNYSAVSKPIMSTMFKTVHLKSVMEKFEFADTAKTFYEQQKQDAILSFAK